MYVIWFNDPSYDYIRRLKEILRWHASTSTSEKKKKLPKIILLLEHHKHAQFECARNHCEWLAEWKTVAFSDERKNYDGF